MAAKTNPRGLTRIDAAAVSPYLVLLTLALMLGRGSMADAPPLVERISQYTRRATSADSWSQGLFRVEVLSGLARATGQWDIAAVLAGLMLPSRTNFNSVPNARHNHTATR